MRGRSEGPNCGVGMQTTVREATSPLKLLATLTKWDLKLFEVERNMVVVTVFGPVTFIKNLIFSRNPVVPSELDCIVSFFYQHLKYAT